MLCRLNVAPFELSWRFAVQVHDGQFELHGCDPEKTYPVHFLDPKNRLGATVMLSGRHVSEPVKVELAPCGTAVARFVDPEGKPLKNYRPSPHIVITPGADLFDESALKKGLLRADADFVANIDRLNYWDGPRTDDRGRCVFPALIPGATYRIHYQSDRTVRAKDFTVEAGKTLDLPDLTIEQSE